MRSIDRDIVSGLILSKDGKLLFGRKDRSKGGVYKDCWHLPGGGIDDGESLEVGLRREVKEEVGIDILGATISLLDNQGRGESVKTLKETGEEVVCKMVFNVYKVEMDIDSNEIQVELNDDLVESKWVDMEQLEDLNVTPPAVELFTRLEWI